MTEPTIVVVVAEAEPRRSLEQQLTRRYGADYQVLCLAGPDLALRRLRQLGRDAVEVPIVIADLWLPEMDGVAFLTQTRESHPTAKRILLFDFYDPAVDDKIIEGSAFGLFDRAVAMQGFPAEEWLYPTIAEFLADWSRGTTRPRFEAVRIIGEQWDARSHTLCDMLNRNSIPFGFYDIASEEGRRQLATTGFAGDRLPVVISVNGEVLVDPSNEAVVATVGAKTEPVDRACDLVVVGGGPAGLSAAVYGASEGLSTVVVEPFALGGQAAPAG